jgi:hypothetical protein
LTTTPSGYRARRSIPIGSVDVPGAESEFVDQEGEVASGHVSEGPFVEAHARIMPEVASCPIKVPSMVASILICRGQPVPSVDRGIRGCRGNGVPRQLLRGIHGVDRLLPLGFAVFFSCQWPTRGPRWWPAKVPTSREWLAFRGAAS